VAYSLIRPISQIPNIRHDGTLSIGNFMLMMKKHKNLEFENLHPKNVLLIYFNLYLLSLYFLAKRLKTKFFHRKCVFFQILISST
jgi:hypothetical protein